MLTVGVLSWIDVTTFLHFTKVKRHRLQVAFNSLFWEVRPMELAGGEYTMTTESLFCSLYKFVTDVFPLFLGKGEGFNIQRSVHNSLTVEQVRSLTHPLVPGIP